MDLSEEGFISGLADATHDLDIGLVVSNAGPNPGYKRAIGLASFLARNALPDPLAVASAVCTTARSKRETSFSNSTSAGEQFALFKIEYGIRNSSGVLKYSSDFFV
jgi:hypothetical protein